MVNGCLVLLLQTGVSSLERLYGTLALIHSGQEGCSWCFKHHVTGYVAVEKWQDVRACGVLYELVGLLEYAHA